MTKLPTHIPRDLARLRDRRPVAAETRALPTATAPRSPIVPPTDRPELLQSGPPR